MGKKNTNTPSFKNGGTMKNNKNNKIKRYAWGLEQYGQAAGLLGAGVGVVAGDGDVGGILSGAATGAASGAALGPIGMIGGGALGAVSGILGNSARRKAALAERRAKQRLVDLGKFQSGLADSEQMAADYYDENPVVPTFEKGGVMPSANPNLAWVDDNEVIQYPDGQTRIVQDDSGITDNVLTTLPNNTVIFSDNVKNPNTGNTFAKDAAKLSKISNKKYSSNNVFSRTSQELNDKYVDKEMRNLKIQQSITKARTGKGAQQYKASTPAYEDGTEDTLIAPDPAFYGNRIPAYEGTMQARAMHRRSLGLGRSADNTLRLGGGMDLIGNGLLPTPASTAVPQAMATTIPSTISGMGTFDGQGVASGTASSALQPATTDWFGIGTNILTDYLSLAPYRNMMSEANRPTEVVQPQHNPYAGNVNRAMRARRASMEPVRAALNRQRAVGRYNANNITGTGQNMAYNLANETAINRSELDAIASNNVQNNAYRGEYANMMNNLGQQSAAAMQYADDATARNIGASRQMRSMAAQQLGAFAQNKQQMLNQQRRDAGMMEALTPYLREGFDQASLTRLLNAFRR